VGAAADAGRSGATFWQWVRHHLAAILSTIADYTLMIVCVELFGLDPTPATAVGAFAGAATNFTLGRFFTYRDRSDVATQTSRYILVSAMSLGLNALGEHLFHDVLGLQYLVARVITSLIVSNGWNYPMHRFFVFSSRRRGPSEHQTKPPA
jgi:putative flippase GtrA